MRVVTAATTLYNMLGKMTLTRSSEINLSSVNLLYFIAPQHNKPFLFMLTDNNFKTKSTLHQVIQYILLIKGCFVLYAYFVCFLSLF